MKKSFLTVILTLSICLSSFSQSALPVNNAKQWMEQRFAKGVIPPFSFVYGGKNSNSFIRTWQYHSEKLPSTEANKEMYAFYYSDKATGLVVKCVVTCFTDFEAVEWVLNFKNTSGKDTPLIEKVAAVDHSFTGNDSGTFIFHHAKGSSEDRTDFQPIDATMSIGKNIYITPSGGKSSSYVSFPFFNIEFPENKGIMVAIGWTGKWYADVVQTDAKSLTLKSGMEKMQLTLYPNEEIRTPKICLLFWEGENRMVGHNRFRQFVLAHHSRKIDGEIADYPLSMNFNLGDNYPCEVCECTTEDYCISVVKRYQQFNLVPEVFWLDAGWYEGCDWYEGGNSWYPGCSWESEPGWWWNNVGNWIPSKKRFPNGLRPVAEAVHEAGAKFLVWFEPERVRPNTIIDREYPEWLLKIEGRKDYLFNLGNKEARIWLTDHISSLIETEGIDIYRQDCNFDPNRYWTIHDKPGRIGMLEIRHIEGLYAFWDSLLVRFPNLLIDNCASGGRRIDLEMTSRSAPLWRTDYDPGEPNGMQCHTYGLNFYLPIHGTGVNTPEDSYTFLSGLNASLVGFCWLTGTGKETITHSRKYMQDFKTLRPYFYGDYYPLTSTHNITSDGVWLAYQLNRPQQKDGIIIAFRRAENNENSINIKPSGLEKDAIYELSYEDYGVQTLKKGSEMMNGFDITIPFKPAALLIKYRRISE